MLSKLICAQAILMFSVAAAARAAGPWRLTGPAIEVTLAADGAMTLVDRSSGKRWEPVVPSDVRVRISAVSSDKAKNSLASTIEIAGASFHLDLMLDAAEPALDLMISAPAETPLHANMRYPFALRSPGGEYRLALPHQAGLLLRAEDAASRRKFTSPFGCYGGGLSMPWVGVTDLRGGLLVILETPEGAGVIPRLEGSVFAPQIYWEPSRGTLGYARKLHYRLFDTGGYVAMCKYYRNRLIQQGRFVTLREKQKSRPQLEKLIGALDLHMRGNDQDERDVIEQLQSKGVTHMLVNSGATKATLDWMRQRGLLVGTYRLYTDIAPAERVARLPPYLQRVYGGYPHDAYTQKDGSPVRGFAYSQQNQSSYRCSLLQLPLMQELLPPLVREKGYEAVFLDVVASDGPRECYHPDHPLNRVQDLREKIKVLQYGRSLGVLVGSEDGADWAAPYVDYFEGVVMLRRFGYVGGVTVATWPKTFEPNEEYTGVELNEKVRAPLWDLVFHDCVVSTWRWNFTPDRYADPKWWPKHDRFYMIGGDMPIFLMSKSHLEKVGQRVLKTYEDVCKWHEKIGWDELVDHRDVRPDRSVQESRFSSGWAVTVNFNDDSYNIYRWKP